MIHHSSSYSYSRSISNIIRNNDTCNSLWKRVAAVAMLSTTTSFPSHNLFLYSSSRSHGIHSNKHYYPFPGSYFLVSAAAASRITTAQAAASSSSFSEEQHRQQQNPDDDDKKSSAIDDRMTESSCQASSSKDNDEASSCTTTTNPTVVTSQHGHLTIHHFQGQPIRSTQDEARRLLQEQQSIDGQTDSFLAVIADEQSNGRGTKGRTWQSGRGNLYLTVCLPFDQLPVMPTLLPLQIAVLVAQQAERALAKCRSGNEDVNDNINKLNLPPKITVKWPNDVLLNEQKLAGTLIESETVEGTTWLLIGIGTNIQKAPSLTKSPGKHGRAATCIQDYCHGLLPAAVASTDAYSFGVDLATSLVDWMQLDNNSKAQREFQVIQQWKEYAEFGGMYEMRGTVEQEDADQEYQGEVVQTVDVRYDGQLVVRGQDGRERLLIADYMF